MRRTIACMLLSIAFIVLCAPAALAVFPDGSSEEHQIEVTQKGLGTLLLRKEDAWTPVNMEMGRADLPGGNGEFRAVPQEDFRVAAVLLDGAPIETNTPAEDGSVTFILEDVPSGSVLEIIFGTPVSMSLTVSGDGTVNMQEEDGTWSALTPGENAFEALTGTKTLLRVSCEDPKTGCTAVRADGREILPDACTPGGTQFAFEAQESSRALFVSFGPQTHLIAKTGSGGSLFTPNGGGGWCLVEDGARVPVQGGAAAFIAVAGAGSDLASVTWNSSPVEVLPDTDSPFAQFFACVYRFAVNASNEEGTLRVQFRPLESVLYAAAEQPRLGLTVADFLKTYADIPGAYVSKDERDMAPLSGDVLCATGMVLRREGLDPTTIVVRGDVLGTGVITLTQLVRLCEAYLGTSPLYGPYLLAGSPDGASDITLTDLVHEAGLLSAS